MMGAMTSHSGSADVTTSTAPVNSTLRQAESAPTSALSPDGTPLRVVVAPDSFKGSIGAGDAARAIADGWRTVRGEDVLELYPQADGGEGTMDAVAEVFPQARWHEVPGVCGPDGRPVTGRWLDLGEGRALTELAQMSGLPQMSELDPQGATTLGLGQVMADALDHQITELLVGLGGSASTDGGAGALVGLGAKFLDAAGAELTPGGAALAELHRIDVSGLRVPDHLVLLTDVESPLLGPTGAAAVFGPQKGATSNQIDLLDAALARFAEVVGHPGDQAGMGAAGGTGYGLAQLCAADIEPGAPWMASHSGLSAAAGQADVVITGEGRFDRTSLQGKVVGNVLKLPGRARRMVIAGMIDPVPGPDLFALVDLATSLSAAHSEPARWLRQAGAQAARRMNQN